MYREVKWHFAVGTMHLVGALHEVNKSYSLLVGHSGKCSLKRYKCLSFNLPQRMTFLQLARWGCWGGGGEQ